MESFENYIPYIISLTLLISGVFALKIDKKVIWTIDGLLSLLGFSFGIFMTFMNIKYVSNELLLLSPTIAISSLFYLRYRNKIIKSSTKLDIIETNKTMLYLIQTGYWLLISFALITYQYSPLYYRPPLFFITISICVALLGVEILSTSFESEFKTFKYIVKIIIVSIILRASAYFVSPFPIGSDPWAHEEYIKSFLYYGHIIVAPGRDFVSQYYLSYPLSHLFVVATSLISNIGTKQSMFILGIILIFSTIFSYLIVKEITNNTKLSLVSILLLNFADHHIQWSIEIIAMSFGISLYTIIIYLILRKERNNKFIYASLLVFYFYIIIWTHTISTFITLISLIALYISSKIYTRIRKICNGGYKDYNGKRQLLNFSPCILMTTILIYHWMDPNYPFFQEIYIGLVETLFAEAKFLTSHTTSNLVGSIWMLPITFGFLVYVFFGIVGTLYSISENRNSEKYFSLIFMIMILYAFRYLFPIFGMKNIIPERWPSFLYTVFILFISIGLYKILSLFDSKKLKIGITLIILFTSTLLMTTNIATNKDSPFYGEEVSQRYVWTESEMFLFNDINNHYKDTIIADKHTAIRPFLTYLQKDRVKMMTYPQLKNGDINWELMSGNLIIWRKSSLKRPVTCDKNEILLGYEFKQRLNNNYNCIYSSGEANAFI